MAEQACYFCGLERAMPGYPNAICATCERLALTPTGDSRWQRPGHAGPFVCEGITVWFRYPAFGGWTAMADPERCDSLDAFYRWHGLLA